MVKVDKKYNFLTPIKSSDLVRLGRNADGGYVVNSEIIEGCKNLISFGMGKDWSFELDYLKKNKSTKIYMYDHSVSSYPYIKDILKYFRRFITFRVKYKDFALRIKSFQSYLKFMNLKNLSFYKEKISHPAKNKNEADIDLVFKRIKSTEDVVMKIDIEGSEYEVINQIIKHSSRIKMLIFEFHFIHTNEKIFFESVKKLQELFYITHIHGNNHNRQLDSGMPCDLEITFLNKKFSRETSEYSYEFPMKNLDFPNNPYKEDIFFSFTKD
tara:strand:- start:5546 stop:6352 length:807 start_codon:yes stop_codon:yes gene_type:complete